MFLIAIVSPAWFLLTVNAARVHRAQWEVDLLKEDAMEDLHPDEWGSLLWDGLDALDESHPAFPGMEAYVEKHFGGAETKSASSPEFVSLYSQFRAHHVQPTRVQAFGLQDTGTNLLWAILHANFGNKLIYHDAFYPANDGMHQKGLWKHANVELINQTFPESKRLSLIGGDVVAIALVREPMSWLRSIHKAPYELKGCVQGDDWLFRQCTHKHPGGYIPVPKATFANMATIWAEWVKAYLRLKDFGYKDALIIRYEDLVKNPKLTMERIAKVLNMTLPKDVTVPTDPAKKHGFAVGYREAYTKITNRSYLLEYQPDDALKVCRELEKYRQELFRYNYTDCYDVLYRKHYGSVNATLSASSKTPL